jgi:hypothetical protein
VPASEIGSERFGIQPAQHAFVIDRVADDWAHGVDFAGRVFDPALDFVERERIIGALVPITLAIDGVEIEPGCVGGLAPVVTLGASNALHGRPLTTAGKMRTEGMRKPAEAAARHMARSGIGRRGG